MPEISVILPTFERAQMLRASAQSVLDQSFRDLELIIVDDGSTEDIAAAAAGLDDPRVVYIRREQNGGAAAARNTGLGHARGRFIAFQDSDDLWLPGKLEQHLELLRHLPESVGVVTGVKILYGRDQKHRYGDGLVALAPDPAGRLKPEEDQVRRFLVSNRLSLQNALFRRTAYPGTSWFDPRAKANNDWEFAARLAQKTTIHEDSQPVVVAFVSGDSISTRPRKKALGLLRILKNNRSVFRRYPDAAAANYLQLARLLGRAGHRRLALRFIGGAVLLHPRLVTQAIGPLRKLMKAPQAVPLRQRPAARSGALRLAPIEPAVKRQA
ncbi:glycosyltransferase family 2 protein [Acuticoccus sediminis]|uniref:Glycosyltransferase family 2 protein n=1 Tax=Acuticoccus sediminis TaxID=2184697 RepID=A0A8B2NRD2_9HYPH|nr:glycosyltransferase family 2 protein [Acuticoccus sediminis]RAH98796.1 glycosyltransferase family 2 protein [Acuticoccus sediminis]